MHSVLPVRFPRTAIVCGVLACALVSPAPSPAQFGPPVLLSLPGERIEGFWAGLDHFENLNVAYYAVEGTPAGTPVEGALVFATLTRDGLFRVPLGEGIDPSLAFGATGVVTAFSRSDPERPGERRIVTMSWLGGSWGTPETLSLGSGDDRSPSLKLWRDQVRIAAWERRVGGGAPRIIVRRDGAAEVDLGPGACPALLLDAEGRAHMLFLRAGDIVHVAEPSAGSPGVFSPPQNLTLTPEATESRPRAALRGAGTILACFAREGEILLLRNDSGSFGAPIQVARGPATNPSLAVSPNEALAIAFEQGGDIHLTLGTTLFLPGARPMAVTPETETDPVVILDSFANRYVVFRRDGGLHYATDAGVPEAKFIATPAAGAVPLRVSFHDESSGSVTSWRWDFGDGATSSAANPTHVYSRIGEYAVTLHVSGPGGESPDVHTKTIVVYEPPNEMRVENVRAYPGQRGLNVPVVVTHEAPAQGVTIAAAYDPSMITIRGIGFRQTNIEGLEPELFAVTISDDPENPFFVAGILFDISPPYEDKVLPPGRDQRIAGILVDVSPGAGTGTSTRIELRNGVGNPPLNNIFTVDGFTVMPVLGDGGVISLPHLSFPPPRFFTRGDATGDGKVNMSDVVSLLDYLFKGGDEPDCHDAADATDDGLIDISDALYELEFLFKSGSYLPPPFPEPGFDPTDDALPPCALR